jgi:hypothetical protein
MGFFTILYHNKNETAPEILCRAVFELFISSRQDMTMMEVELISCTHTDMADF